MTRTLYREGHTRFGARTLRPFAPTGGGTALEFYEEADDGGIKVFQRIGANDGWFRGGIGKQTYIGRDGDTIFGPADEVTEFAARPAGNGQGRLGRNTARWSRLYLSSMTLPDGIYVAANDGMVRIENGHMESKTFEHVPALRAIVADV